MASAPSKTRPTAIAAGLVLVLWIALTKLPVAWNEDRWDSRWYQLTGLQILDGARPYRDFWDLKPPGIFYLMAFGGLFSDTSLAQFAVLDGLFNLLALAVLSRMLRVLGYLGENACPGGRGWRLGVPGWLCIALAAVLSSHTAIAANGNLTESYLLLPEALCLAAGLGALRRPQRTNLAEAVSLRESFLAGLFAAAAAWIRPTGLAGIGALELAWLAHGRWRLCLAGIGGLACGLAPGIAVFWSWGLVAEMFHAVVAFPLSDAHANRAPLLERLGNVWPLAWPALLVLAWLMWRALSPARTCVSSPRFLEARTAVLLWVAADLAGAVLPGQHRQHYFLPLSLSLPIAAALPLAGVWRGRGDSCPWRPRLRWGRRGLTAICVIWILVAASVEFQHVLAARPVEQSKAPWMQVVRFLRPRVSPGELIFVADYVPSIYVLTKTRPASPWVGLERAHDVGRPTERSRETAFRRALSARPRFIVSTSRTPVKRAVSILERRALRVFAAWDWVVWRPLDARRGERIVARWAPASDGLASSSQTRTGNALQAAKATEVETLETMRGVDLQVPAAPCPTLLVSVAFQGSAEPWILETRRDGKTDCFKLGGIGRGARVESFEIPFPRDGRIQLWARRSDGRTVLLDLVELAAVAER
jgi:hypothetical protein